MPLTSDDVDHDHFGEASRWNGEEKGTQVHEGKGRPAVHHHHKEDPSKLLSFTESLHAKQLQDYTLCMYSWPKKWIQYCTKCFILKTETTASTYYIPSSVINIYQILIHSWTWHCIWDITSYIIKVTVHIKGWLSKYNDLMGNSIGIMRDYHLLLTKNVAKYLLLKMPIHILYFLHEATHLQQDKVDTGNRE